METFKIHRVRGCCVDEKSDMARANCRAGERRALTAGPCFHDTAAGCAIGLRKLLRTAEKILSEKILGKAVWVARLRQMNRAVNFLVPPNPGLPVASSLQDGGFQRFSFTGTHPFPPRTPHFPAFGPATD